MVEEVIATVVAASRPPVDKEVIALLDSSTKTFKTGRALSSRFFFAI